LILAAAMLCGSTLALRLGSSKRRKVIAPNIGDRAFPPRSTVALRS
jgi:hypothetical protein